MKQILLAIQFLTIIPVTVKGACTEEDLAGSASFFPLAGAVQGLLIAAAAYVALNFFTVEIASALVITVLLLSDGGFDIDGLIDTFDALAVKSTGDRERDIEKRLLVMKDSSIGAIGATALVVSVLLKFVLLNYFLRISTLPVILASLFIIPVFSKWVTVFAMFLGKPARKDGLGRIFMEGVQKKQLVLSSLVLLVFYMITTRLYIYPQYVLQGVWLFAVIMPAACMLTLLTMRITLGKFGGLTGDHMGALSECTEVLLLAVIPAWLQHST
ncbi:MAG: adenosylcobinamide-GDP ribazoletransferase [Nitrospirae bacterium]|nr:adenosylcobinamide-GDP ribazoletransferase [Nitrospirota bacterium]